MRKGLLIAGLVLTILGAILSIIPSTESRNFTAGSFGGSFGEWHLSDPFSLPGGIGLKLSWNGNQDMTMGIATKAAADAFQRGATNSLSLLAFGSGRSSGFSLTIPESGQYVLAASLTPFFGSWAVSMDVEMTTPFAYAILGVPILVVGLILLMVGAALKPKVPIPAPPAPAQPAAYQPPPQGTQRVQYGQRAPPQQPAAPQAPVNLPASSYPPPPINPSAPQWPQPTPGTGPHFTRSFCIECGAPLAAGAAFCGACGTRAG